MSQPPPDVTACELAKARSLVGEAGWQVARVVHSRAPRAGYEPGPERVARVRVMAEGELEFVVVTPPAPPDD